MHRFLTEVQKKSAELNVFYKFMSTGAFLHFRDVYNFSFEENGGNIRENTSKLIESNKTFQFLNRKLGTLLVMICDSVRNF